MMNVACWNIQGLYQPHKQKAVYEFTKKLDIIGIVENKVRFCNINKIFRRSLPRWDMVNNSNGVGVGRVWACWNPAKVKFQAILFHTRATTGNARINDAQPTVITMVYARNTDERRELWGHLNSLEKICTDAPWLILDDFNCIGRRDERIGSDEVNADAMVNFNTCLEEMDMNEYPVTGCFFIWDNLRDKEDRIYSKIDRCFVNEKWLKTFS